MASMLAKRALNSKLIIVVALNENLETHQNHICVC